MISGTVLIVDDNSAMCDNMEDILRENGYEPFSAHSCSDGLRLAEERRPNVALLDLKLPDGLGIELLAGLKNLDPDCICIIITAFADVDSALIALERGAFHYMHKPVRPTELLQLLHRAFEIIRLRDEKREATEALIKSERKYRSLVENLNIGIYRATVDLPGHFIQANPAMARIFGYDSVDEFMNLPILALYKNSEERKMFLEELARHGSVRDKELLSLKKDGEPIWVSCTATSHCDETGKMDWIDGVVEDITSRKRLEEQLRQSQKMEAIGTLAGGVAHDFNNILTAIIGFTSLLQMKIEPGAPLRRYVDSIMTSSEKASKLTRDLLAFSRKQFIDLKPIRINDTVIRLESLLQRIIGEDIELKTVLSADDPTIMADGPQIEQVLMNIATNARGAMPEGGMLIIETGSVKLDDSFVMTHGYGESGTYAVISVTDSGIGMDAKTRERIFEPFFTTKEVGKGTGLGLSIAYGIIKHHNGYITVYSEPGKGTTFRIFLPSIRATVEFEEPGEIEELPRGNEIILLAEDDGGVRALQKDLLEAFGYTVIEAVDGEDAVQTFKTHREEIQLLILDVVMPKKNGKEAYDEIKQIKPGIKALFASGYTDDILNRKGIFEDGLNFCSKPVMPKEFLHKVRGTLDS